MTNKDDDIEKSFEDFIPRIVRGETSYPTVRVETDYSDRQDIIAMHILACTFTDMMSMSTSITELLAKETPTAFTLAVAMVQWANQRKASSNA